MKAAVRYAYTEPIRIEELPRPVPKPNELLVRVHATTVNRTDCAILTGKPAIMKLVVGWPKPRVPVTGTDFAGVVEAVGNKVTRFTVGDNVWGFDDTGSRSHAEFLTVAEHHAIDRIPDGMSFEQAASSIEGGHYAYNFITKVNLRTGCRVLVNGATGAIGSAVVQFLKHLGALVTAVCPGAYADLVQSLGADDIIDFTKDDFTKSGRSYDFVFDAVGKSTFAACKPLLVKGGVYISSELGPHNENPFLALTTRIFGSRKVVFPVPVNIPRSMKFVSDLLSRGKFKPVIDRVVSLGEIAEAFRYAASGQKIGNIVLRMNA